MKGGFGSGYCAALIFALVVIGNCQIHSGYYWRDYSGEIPSDAVPGGLDKGGRTTYIGQALHQDPNGKLIPGKINSIDKKMYYAWSDTEYPVTKNVKILCSQIPENFEWIETNVTQLQSSDQTNFVVGGYDTSYPLFIGRIRDKGEVVVGKVTIQTPYEAMGYAVDGKAYFVETTFEILSYKPTHQGTTQPKCPTKVVKINIY